MNAFRKFFLSLFAISLVLICSAEKVDTQQVKQLAIQALVLENSNPDSSILLAKSILKESLPANYNQGLSYAYHRLGSSFNAIGINDSALIYINKAIAIRTKLKDIQSGKFAKQWMDENKNGQKNFLKMRKELADHPIEKVGKKLRALMPWIGKNKLVDKEKN